MGSSYSADPVLQTRKPRFRGSVICSRLCSLLVAGIPAQWQTESRLLPYLPSGFAFSWTTEVYILHLKKTFWEREDPHRSSDSRNLCGPWWPSLEVPALPILATLSGYEPGPETSDSAGEPWPLFPQRGRNVPLQLCQATCSLLERALLTLWFLGHGLPASGRGGDHSAGTGKLSGSGLSKGMGNTIMCWVF